MKRFYLVCFMLLTTLFPAFAQDDVREFRGYQPYSDNIGFTYDARIADGAQDRLNPYNAPPQFTEIVFQDYVEGTGWIDRSDYVRVYPVAEFQPGLYVQYLQILDSLIRNRSAAPPQIPALPWQEPPQSIGNLAYLDFQTGSGVRYTGNFSSLGDLYSFQGLTADGVYYLAAWFKLTDPAQIAMYDALFASLTVTSPQATFMSEGDGINVDYDGISFTVDSALGRRIEATVFEPYVETEPGSTMFGSTPGYTEFDLFGYPVASPYEFPHLLVLPADSFVPDSPSAAELDRLQAFVAGQALLTPQIGIDVGARSLPVIPLINAAQVFVIHPEWVEFENGSGYRFIAYYAQGIDQVTNNALFYVFQGVTDDGANAVAAYFPIRTSILPNSFDPRNFPVPDEPSTPTRLS